MSKLILLILFLLAIFSRGGTLEVMVKNIQAGKGNIVVEVYDKDVDFFKKPIARKSILATNASLTLAFNLPVGEYAVAVYQDINSNNKLDKGIFNIPKEPYGLSNDFRPSFSAPRFADCKFRLEGEMSMMITLK